MSYGQYMKHWKNHRKDRHYQQCSGYAGDGKCDAPMTNEQMWAIERESFEKLLEEAKTFPFPVHIFQIGLYWRISNEPNLRSCEVKTYEELVQYGRDYVV